MKLNVYLEKKKMTQREFADKANINHSTLSYYIAKARKPQLEIAMKINRASKNNVKFEDLLTDEQLKNVMAV